MHAIMKKQIKVAKGYRLFPKTHNRISKIKELLNTDSDKAISAACIFYIKNFSDKTKTKK